MKIFFCYVIFVVSLCAQELPATQHHYYFYHPDHTYGSDAQFGPLSLFINGSYDILRNGGHGKNIFRQPYSAGAKNVWQNISNPVPAIRDFGAQQFFDQEIFNLQLNVKHAEFLPNIVDHTIGNGMQYAKLAEYLDYRDVRYPYLWSALVTSAYQFMNEAIENDYYVGTNVDPISDILIFNTLGIGLFSFDITKHFFSHVLPVYDWSPQPVFEPMSGRMQNAGQQYVMRKKIPYIENFSFFFYWGIYAMPGISYTVDHENSISFAYGQVVNKLKEGRELGRRKIDPDLDGAIGFFYDRNNSLMASLLLTGPGLYNAQLNIYPGIISENFGKPGFFLGAGEWDKFIFGITFADIPIGFGVGSR